MIEQKQGKCVLVSGASRGIGRQCALALAGAGYHVLAGVRTRAAADELEGLNNNMLQPVQLDITDKANIETLVNELADKEIHGLVNNAGTAVLGPLEFLPLEEIRKEFEVNLFGHIALIQAFLPKLRAVKGRIINISSISGFIGFPFFGAYGASKFALEGLSDALRRELRHVGVAVSVIQPGNIDTDIWPDSFTKGKSLENRFPDEARRVYGKRFEKNESGSYGPLHKSGPEIVAAAVVTAMTEKRPRCRYLVGKDARRFNRLRRYLPDAFLDKFI